MKRITLLSLLLSGSVLAGQVVTLEDGRKVILNDDFTWGYVAEPVVAQPKANKPMAETAATNPVAALVVIAAPVKKRTTGTELIPGSNKPTLQLSESGVDIVLGSARFDSGILSIPTALTNQSTQSVIGVTLEITLSDPQGEILSQQEVKVWQSIKRMAETYLRPQSQVSGKTMTFKIKPQASYQIEARVISVETR